MASSNSFNKSSQDISDCSSTSTKYGDSDLASKRRKGGLDDLDDRMNDLVYADFKNSIVNSRRLNDILQLSEIERGSIGPNTRDYNTELSSPVNNPSCTNMLFVSSTPSGTSCGFENTFRILETQIQTNRNRRMLLRRISEEYIPNWNSLTPANTDSVTNDNLLQDSDEPPSFLELELEAMQRIKDQLQKMPEFSKHLQHGNDDTASETSPNKEMLNNSNPFAEECSASAVELFGGEAIIDVELGYPEYVYHIAKGKDGRKYLRVVRSLLLDKVLCGNRVSQMTRTYDDIEAVTHLLGEKEKDLELTVQIGKELLQQNNRLENRITELEAELKCSNEDRAQLLHDLHQKNELIAVLTSDVDDGSESDTPNASKSITLELMQRKISSLQDENKSLKLEASLIVEKTDEVEEKERKLMEDITSQLNSTNMQFDGVSLELERMKEENRFQHEQIISLTARLAEAELRLHQLTTENDEQVSLLSITKENQNMLTTELAEFKVRYQEVLSLLQEAQEQLRKQRRKVQPQGRSTFIPGMGLGQTESLHSELMESSLYSDNSLDSGISADRMIIGPGTIPSYSKVFETVRCGTRSGHYSDCTTQLGAMSMSSISQPRMTAVPFLSTSINSSIGSYHRPSSVYSGSNYPSYETSLMGVKTMSCESLASHSEDGYPTQPTGVPGAPGAKDLEAALKRLTHGEVLARRAMLSHAPAGTYTYDESQNTAPLGLRTPDSIMSTGSGSSGMVSNLSGNHWRLPEKLQIVKPMEGSQTLHHWSRLATPTLSGLLEERPGVKIRGGRGLEDLGLQIYSLSDVEEDIEDHPGKQFQPSGCIYTYTNSTVMHPDDGTIGSDFLSHSQLSSRIASNTTSRQSSCPPTPHAGLSRRNSCSTFSVHTGLASMLNERGIKAVTPSAINTPAGPNFSPTVTPCNSPEGSPTRSMSPEPLFGILSSGADLIRRKLMGEAERPTRSHIKQQKILLSRLEKRALRSLRLVEKVESVGLENIIATQPSVRSQLASGIASRSASPMAQLSNLRNGPLDDLQFDRNQIRAVLSKGLSNDSIKSLTESDTGISVSCESSECVNITLPSAQSSPMTTTTTTTSISAQSETSAADTDIRLKHMQRQKSRRSLKNGIGGQRPDLGTVGGRVRSDLGKVKATTNVIGSVNSPKQDTSEEKATQSITQSFVGSISSIFFGRKGGWF